MVTVPPPKSAMVPPPPRVTVPPPPSVTVPPLERLKVPGPLRVTTSPLANVIVPLAPGAMLPPALSIALPGVTNCRVPPPLTTAPLPTVTEPPLTSVTEPPAPSVAVPPPAMLSGVGEEPKERTFASDANSPPVAPTCRRSRLARSLYPTRPGNPVDPGCTPSKVMFWLAVHAGVTGATDPSTKYPVSPGLSGLPSQCSVAALSEELGGSDGAYHAEPPMAAGLLLTSSRLATEPSEPSVSVSSVWLEKVIVAFGPTPSSWNR